ncbi:MAG: hypothetical protein H6553_13635 [Chitinophagales bacterium]|nr:hypothetical protein [Chitinophagales bacterium]
MIDKKSKWQQFWEKLRLKYRFQIVDDISYAVKFVFELNLLNIITISGILIALFMFLNFLLIAYTPLKRYIPGYGTTSSRKEAIELSLKTEQLEKQIDDYEQYVKDIKAVLKDEARTVKRDEEIKTPSIDSSYLVAVTVNEAAFINEIEKGLKNADLNKNIQDAKTNVLGNLKITAPSTNKIKKEYSDKHKRIEYAKGDSIVNPLDGKVIVLIDNDDGTTTLAIQHEHDLVSIFKNITINSLKTGTFVKESAKIAANEKGFVYQLWYQGKQVNPIKYYKK